MEGFIRLFTIITDIVMGSFTRLFAAKLSSMMCVLHEPFHSISALSIPAIGPLARGTFTSIIVTNVHYVAGIGIDVARHKKGAIRRTPLSL